MTDTPETDAEAMKGVMEGGSPWHRVPTEFARRLERERNARVKLDEVVAERDKLRRMVKFLVGYMP